MIFESIFFSGLIKKHYLLSSRRAVREHTQGVSHRGRARSVRVLSEDIDGDGDPDIISCSYVGHDIVWFENTSSNGLSWTADKIVGNFDCPKSVNAGDLIQKGDALDDDNNYNGCDVNVN